jgi:hypothetical protein
MYYKIIHISPVLGIYIYIQIDKGNQSTIILLTLHSKFVCEKLERMLLHVSYAHRIHVSGCITFSGNQTRPKDMIIYFGNNTFFLHDSYYLLIGKHYKKID